MLCNPPQFSESDELATKWKKRASMIAADPLKQSTWTDYPSYVSTSDPELRVSVQRPVLSLYCTAAAKGSSRATGSLEQLRRRLPTSGGNNLARRCRSSRRLRASYYLCRRRRPSLSASILSLPLSKTGGGTAWGTANRTCSSASFTTSVLRLLKRMRKLLYTEQCVGWNDEDKKTGSFALVRSSL